MKKVKFSSNYSAKRREKGAPGRRPASALGGQVGKICDGKSVIGDELSSYRALLAVLQQGVYRVKSAQSFGRDKPGVSVRKQKKVFHRKFLAVHGAVQKHLVRGAYSAPSFVAAYCGAFGAIVNGIVHKVDSFVVGSYNIPPLICRYMSY